MRAIYNSRFLRAAAALLAFAPAGFVLCRLPAMPAEADYKGVTAAWLGAIVLYMWAMSPLLHRRKEAPTGPRTKSSLGEPLILAAIVLAALFLRVWKLGGIPPILAGDEASQGLEALRVVRGELRNPFTTGWLSVPTMSFFFNSISLRILGPTTTALRLPWAFVGTATILTSFYLVKCLKGPRLALATTAFLAVYHYHIHFSRLGSNQIADPFLASVSLLFLCRALESRRPITWAAAGLATGAGLYFYAGARFALVLVTAVLAYQVLVGPRRFFSRHLFGLVIALGAFLISAGPMIQYAIRFPNDFNARVNAVGVFQSGWIQKEMDVTGQSKASILFDQFRRAALAFNYYPDRTSWYGLREPLLDPFFGALFLLGLGYATVRALAPPRADRALFPMVAWWWGTVILGGMLTNTTPSSQRLITLSVPVCFFIALALDRLLELAKKGMPRLPVWGIMPAAVLLFAVISWNTYFVDCTRRRLYGGRHAEIGVEAAPILNELKSTRSIFFLGAPKMYWGFATLPYLVQDARASDILEPLKAPPNRNLVNEKRGAVFVFLPERTEELRWVRKTFPTGALHRIHTPTDGSVIATLYDVPPGAKAR